MLLHLGKAYYALEAKTMATEELLPAVAWDMDCDCDPPPFFHLPPPPAPPGILGPLEHTSPDDCNGPWTCPALALEVGGTFGQYGEGNLKEASPEVSVSVIVVSTTMLGIFLIVAAIIFFRMWRTYKASSKKASCDLDGTDLYEDMPAAPPLLAPPRHPGHCPQPLRYKEELLPPPRGGLPPTPGLHLYSPEPRPDTPSDHLYHHISSSSETCSCNTSEAPSNALLPTTLQLIHSEEDEEASSSSSHSYNSSSTATPTSSPTPAMSHPCPPMYLCPPNIAGGPPSSALPAYAPSSGGIVCSRGKHKHGHNAPHPSSLQPAVYAVNPVHPVHEAKQGNVLPNNMVPLAQIYPTAAGHLYESATLIRPNANMIPNCSMMYWGNVPTSMVQAVHSHQTLKPSNQYDPRQLPAMIPMHNTMVHPLQYYGHVDHNGHSCMVQHSPQHMVNANHYPASITRLHQPHIHQYQPPSHLHLPLHSSTLIPNNISNKQQIYDNRNSPDDITPTNSIPIDSIYNASPRSENSLIATTCLSTRTSIPDESEYCTTLDAINLNQQQQQAGRDPYHDEPAVVGGVSDTSSSSHPSETATTVTESSSLDSSGTASSTLPLANNVAAHRPDLPALPSRADRYRIYARNNDAQLGNRCSSYKRPQINTNVNNVNNNNDSGVVLTHSSDQSNSSDSTSARSSKSCDDLNNLSPIDNNRVLPFNREQFHMDANNAVNNNFNGNDYRFSRPPPGASKHQMVEMDPPSPPEEFASRSYGGRRSRAKKSSATRTPDLVSGHSQEEDDLYDRCSDT